MIEGKLQPRRSPDQSQKVFVDAARIIQEEHLGKRRR
jgi:hypothetical protein